MANINDEDITNATDTITQLFGAEKDSDVGDMCSTLVTEFVSDFKTSPDGNTIDKLCSTAQSIIGKLESNKIDRSKMQSTLGRLDTFMQNSDKTFKDMKDTNGNPIGEDIMEKLKGPLQFMSSMQKGGSAPDMSQLMGMLSGLQNMGKK